MSLTFFAVAGILSGSQKPGHSPRGSISLKHVYEIAKARSRARRGPCAPYADIVHRAQVKKTDPGGEFVPLQSICNSIIGTAKSMGVTVVK